MKISRFRIVENSFYFAILFALFVSGALLNLVGLNYSGDESASGLKIHPYVIFTFFAIFSLTVPFGEVESKLKSKKFNIPLICSAILVAILIAKSISGSRQSLGFAVDTLVSAFWAAAIIPFMNPNFAKKIWKMGFLFLIAESAIAIFEVVFNIQFIPINTWYGSFFRATALHGHPLNNALILVTVSISLQLSAKWRGNVVIFLMTVGALSAFGARGALSVFVFVNSILLIRYGLKSPNRMLSVLLAMPAALLVLIWIVLSGTLGDRIANVGAYDDSSGVRLQSLQMLTNLNWNNLLFGVDPDQILRIMANENVNVIENFLVAYVFMFGLACTVAIFFFAVGF